MEWQPIIVFKKVNTFSEIHFLFSITIIAKDQLSSVCLNLKNWDHALFFISFLEHFEKVT